MVDVAIIGVGPAGLEAAREARRRGLNAVLIGMTPPGGRSAMGSLLPSKVWLHAAERVSRRAWGTGGPESTGGTGDAGGTAPAGAEAADPAADPAGAITAEIREIQSTWTGTLAERLKQLDIPVYRGRAVLADSSTVEVRSPDDGSVIESIVASNVILATGSEPTFAPQVKPDGERIIAPRHTQTLTAIPEHIVFAGGGVTGTEYASAFARLGSRVEVFTRGETLLPHGEPEAAAYLTDVLERSLGIVVHRSASVTDVRRSAERVVTVATAGSERVEVESEYAFIATGRHADLAVIEEGPADFAATFARRPDGGLLTDEYARTSVRGVYAVGDAAGAPLVANKATWEARSAVGHIVGETIDSFAAFGGIVEAVYTRPQAAWIGPVHDLPSEPTGRVGIVRKRFDSLLLAHIDHATDGFLKIWFDADTRLVLGASAVGAHAAELMTPIQLSIFGRLSVDQLTSLPGPHPTFSELVAL